MNEWQSDFELLQAFSRRGEQGAFAQLARRHLDLVYATALLKLQEPPAAQEVAQNVFSALARKSWQFGPDDSLPAWLYKTTLLEAKDWLRGEMRRRRREQTAAQLGTTMNTPDEQTALRALLPLLDEALLSLREKERAALLLRFYENQSLRQVGSALGVGEDAAQKRVAAALDKLSAFFQRRGFRTATAASAAAALQSTATSAPAAVAHSVVLAAGQLAPPTLLGLAALGARLASCSKAHTAALCLALALAPAAWHWRQLDHQRVRLVELQSQLQSAHLHLSSIQSDIERLSETAARLEASIATASATAGTQSEARLKFEAWKRRLRAQLLAQDYHWPEDSPFVRIPKSALRQLDVRSPIASPGVLKPCGRELLGLTPQEREQFESALHSHFAAMESLLQNNIYQTNSIANIGLPSSAVASQLWMVPALGQEAQARAEELQSGLKELLGPERWPLVEAQLQTHGTHSLRQLLNLDAASNSQQLGVWITQSAGKCSVGFGWSGLNSSFSTDLGPLEWFRQDGTMAPSDVPKPPEFNALQEFYLQSLPESLQQRLAHWLQQQAALRLPKELPR